MNYIHSRVEPDFLQINMTRFIIQINAPIIELETPILYISELQNYESMWIIAMHVRIFKVLLQAKFIEVKIQD